MSYLRFHLLFILLLLTLREKGHSADYRGRWAGLGLMALMALV